MPSIATVCFGVRIHVPEDVSCYRNSRFTASRLIQVPDFPFPFLGIAVLIGVLYEPDRSERAFRH